MDWVGRFTVLAAFASVAAGCGGAPVAPPSVPAAEAALRGPLVRLLPAGADWFVTARPAALCDDETSRTVLDAVVPPRRREAFALRTGVDPCRVREAVYAQYGQGSLLLVRGALDAELAVREAGDRMAPVEASSDTPRVRRIGFFGDVGWDVVVLDRDAIAVGHEARVAMAELLAGIDHPESLRRSLRGDDAEALFDAYAGAPLVLYALGALPLPPGSGVSVLLAEERALAAAATTPSADAVHVEVTLRGEFPEGAAENFRALLRSIAGASLGAAFGLGEALESLEITTSETGITLAIDLPLLPLVRGVSALFSADLEALVGTGEPP